MAVLLSKRKCLVCNVVKTPLFRLPTDSTRLMSWLNILQRTSLIRLCSAQYLKNNARICNEHFEEKMFTSTLRNRLHYTADPKGTDNVSVPNPDDPSHVSLPIILSEDVSTGASIITPTPQSPTREMTSTRIITTTPTRQVTPKTREIFRLRSNLSKSKRSNLKRLDPKKIQGLESVKSQLNAVQYDFVKAQIDFANRDSRGRRWSAAQKSMALNIYYHSPSAYSILRKIFAFPCKNTLKKSTRHIAKQEGICPIVLKALKNKVERLKKDQDKWCTLVIDEMSIKSSLSYNATLDKIDGYESIPRDGSPQLATQALVFMLRGVFTNTKQVISYYFRGHSNDHEWFHKIVLETIDKIYEVGLQIIATVCDQGPINQRLYRDLGATCDKPFFERNGRKIYVLCDVPHLLKSVRNNLRNYDFEFLQMKDCNEEEKKTFQASWKHIKQFYESDSKKSYRLAPKITKQHIDAVGLSSMKVKYAAQVFSNTVACALANYVENGHLEARASGTVDFVDSMNKLFDSLNSRRIYDKTPYLCAVSGDSIHLKFWSQCINWIKSWKIIHPSGKAMKLPCQRGFIMTLNAMLGVWDVLSKEMPLLLTNRFNQDCIENAFSSLRRHGGNRDNPDTSQFRVAIKYIIVHNFLKKSELANCEDDSAKNLLDMSGLNESSLIMECDEEDNCVENDLNHIDIKKDEVPTCDIMEENALAYIAGFLSMSYLKKITCDICQNLLVGEKVLEPHTVFLYFKDYKIDSKYGLKWPTDNYYTFVKDMGEMFNIYFDIYFFKQNIRKNISAELWEGNFDFFSCNVHSDGAKTHVINSFVTMMIKHRVKVLNSSSFVAQTKKKLKHVKNL